MKKFRILSIIFALLMVLTIFVGCGNTENKNDPTENNTNGQSVTDADNGDTKETTTSETQSDTEADTSEKENENTHNSSSVTKIVNDEGEEFIVDLSNVGKIKENAESISSTKIELAGKAYSFPIKMSELLDNGWNLSDAQTEIEANSEINLVSFYLTHESGMKIVLVEMVNDSAAKKNIKECTLTHFWIDPSYLESENDFVLPGGIVLMSTAANVLDVFGDPNTSTVFTDYSYSGDDYLSYNNHSDSNICYGFSFNEDGTISKISVEYAK